MRASRSAAAGVIGLVFAFPALARADRISDVTETNFWEQAVTFFDWSNLYLRDQAIGCALIGICCGLLGSFIVVRRIALVGDMLSHAILPGIVLGFLWNATKDPVNLLIGAVIAGLLGAALATGLSRTTTLKTVTSPKPSSRRCPAGSRPSASTNPTTSTPTTSWWPTRASRTAWRASC